MMADENANERFDLGKETHRMREAEMARCIEIFNTAPELRASFLVKLQNGATVNGVHGICSRCKRRIDPADVHGRVSWPIAAVAVVEASGICRPCSTMTQLYLRLRPTGIPIERRHRVLMDADGASPNLCPSHGGGQRCGGWHGSVVRFQWMPSLFRSTVQCRLPLVERCLGLHSPICRVLCGVAFAARRLT